MKRKISSTFNFVAGFLTATLILGVSAFAINVNNTPEGGYLLCANNKTNAVTYARNLKCPSGTTPIQVPGTTSDISNAGDDSETSSSTPSTQTDNNAKGSANCVLSYLQANPNQINTIVQQCSTSQLSKLQTDLSAFQRDSQIQLDREMQKGEALRKEAEAKKGTAGAQAANDAVEKQAALVAELMAKTRSNIAIQAAIVNAIAKKVKK